MLHYPRMGYKAQRIGFSVSRGWTLLLLVIGGLIAASFWIGPLRPLPAELQLLAVAGNSALTEVEATGQLRADGTVRFAVPLAVRNVGFQPAEPWQLQLSMPGHYHLTTRRGRLAGEVTAGVPLRRYTIDLTPTHVPVDNATMRLPGLDTIWLEPDLPRYYCQLGDGQVPEFLPAPDRDPAQLSRVSIFYSFRTANAAERHSGLLAVRLDTAMLRSQPAPMPPSFPTVFLVEPDEDDPAAETVAQPADSATAPADSAGDSAAADGAARADTAGAGNVIRLVAGGSRRAYCGDPEAPVDLYTTIHETADGGRVYTVHVAGAARKRLYDMNGDDVIELERWDSDGNGFFEARRQARFEVPDFLKPLPPLNPEMLEPDTVPPDSAFLQLFGNTAAGPFRFSRSQDQVAPDRAIADSLRRDSLLPDSLRPSFDSVQSGGTSSDSVRTGATVSDSLRPAAGAPPAPVDTARADTAVAPPPAPPARRGPIGTPVRLPPPDTLSTTTGQR